MKKIFNILLATAVIATVWSCTTDDADRITYHPKDTVAPVLSAPQSSYELTEETKNENITFDFSAASFGAMVPVTYNLEMALASDSEFASARTLVKGVSATEINATKESISSAVTFLNGKSYEATDMIFRIAANWIGASGTVATVYSNVVTSAVTPYRPATIEYKKIYVIGKFNGWSHDKDLNLFCYLEDDDTYEGVVDFGYYGNLADHKVDGFKLTGVPSWDDPDQNWGAVSKTEGEYEVEPSSVQLISGNSSQDILSYQTHRYYKFSFSVSTLKLVKIYGFDQIGIIGNGGDWNNDIVMEWNPAYQRFYVDATLTGDSFKFRSDASWGGLDLGGTLGSITAGGGNIEAEAGNYRVYLYMNDSNNMHAELNSEMYGKEEPTSTGGDEPTPEPEVWSIIGTVNSTSWDTDFDMTEVQSGVWEYRKLSVTSSDEFKLRFQHDWANSVGGTEENASSTIDSSNPYGVFQPTVGTPFATADKNIQIGEAGNYNLTYDVNAGTITVDNYAAAWSVIGEVNGTSWSTDFFMTETESGVWKSEELTINGGFKIRYDCGWDVNMGAAEGEEPVVAEIGTTVAAAQGGKNLTVAETGKTYYITYNANDNTITVTNGARGWSLIGNVGDDTTWSVDSYMTQMTSGLWISNAVAITGEFKLRYNGGWDSNRGGTNEALGKAFGAVAGGDNITVPETGKLYQIVYNPMVETITVYSVEGWGVVGNIESTNWNFDIMMGENNGVFTSPMFQLYGDGSTSWGCQIRKNGWINAWADGQKGGVFAELGVPFAVTEGNILPAETDNGKVYTLTFNSVDNTFTLNGVWALIGNVEGTVWSEDFYLTETSTGVWERKSVNINGEFKVRFNSSWGDADTRGLSESGSIALGTETVLSGPGNNIGIDSGKYDVKWVPATNSLTVTAVE